jgi:hypothetical protein
VHGVGGGQNVHAENPGDDGQHRGNQARTAEERGRVAVIRCAQGVPPYRAGFAVI